MFDSRAARAGASLLALAALVTAFLLLRPSDDDPTTTTTPRGTAPTAPAPTTSPPRTAKTPTTSAARPPAPDYLRLRPDRVRRIQAQRGDTVRLEIVNPTTEELHVHGYDLSRALPAGRRVRLRFVASITGVFEIELEGAGRQVAELTVEP
jgi:FtsP/CotA-like multicopper oxidase with cupredoxin domain